MSFDPLQPTSQQNPQNAAVENQSVGQFKDWEIIDKNNDCFKGISEKVSGGFSVGRSIGRIWNAVKEGVSAFFQKLFGEKSGAPTVKDTVNAEKVIGSERSPGTIASGAQNNTSDIKQTQKTVPTKPKEKVSVPESSAENGRNVSVGSSQPKDDISNPLNTSEPNTLKVPKKTASETSSTQSTASVKKDTASKAPNINWWMFPVTEIAGFMQCWLGQACLERSNFRRHRIQITDRILCRMKNRNFPCNNCDWELSKSRKNS